MNRGCLKTTPQLSEDQSDGILQKLRPKVADRRANTLDARDVAHLSRGLPKLTPWTGQLAAGRHRNFLGVLLPDEGGVRRPARYNETRLPCIADGEGFSEWFSTA